MTNLVPTRIVDRNGKETTVHKRQQRASIRNLFGLARPPRVFDRPETVVMTAYKETLIDAPDGNGYIHDEQQSKLHYQGDVQRLLDCYYLEDVIDLAESSTDRKYLYIKMLNVGMIDNGGMNFGIDFDIDSLNQYIEYRQVHNLEEPIEKWRNVALPFAESMTRITLDEKSREKPSEDQIKEIVDALSDTTLDGGDHSIRYNKVRSVLDNFYGDKFTNAYTMENLYSGVGLGEEISSEWFQNKP